MFSRVFIGLLIFSTTFIEGFVMKSPLKFIFTGIVASSGLLLGAVDANAVCAQEGAIEYSQTNAGGTQFYITDETTALPTFAYVYFAPLNTAFHETLSDAQAAGQIVEVTGNAATCPVAGTFRNAGVVTKVERHDQ
jgi:hypothetical protein